MTTPTTLTERTTMTSLNVAGGRGLAVPLQPVPHDPTPRRSSAPPFLRRDPDLLAVLDGMRPAVAAPKPARNPRPRREPKPRLADERPQPRAGTTYPQRERAVDRMDLLTKQMIAEDYAQGATLAQVAAGHPPLSQDIIKTVLADQGVPVRAPYNRERPPMTEQQVDEAQQLYAEGASLAELAERYATGKARLVARLKERGVTIRPSGYYRKP